MPLLLVILVDGKRGARQTWPIALSVGATFAVAQFFASNFLSVELTDIVAVAGRASPPPSSCCASGPRRVATRPPRGCAPTGRGVHRRSRTWTTTGGAGSGAAPTRTVEQAPAVAETRA